MSKTADSLHTIMNSIGTQKMEEIVDFMKHIDRSMDNGASQKEMEILHFKFNNFIKGQVASLDKLNAKFLELELDG